MDCNTANTPSQPAEQGCICALRSLAAALEQVPNQRKRRGLRFRLGVTLVVELAKLAGADQVTGIAEWAQARAEWLLAAFGPKRKRLPHRTTYSPVLARGAAGGLGMWGE